MQQPPAPQQPPPQPPSLWTALAYYGIFYLLMLIVVLVGYPLAQQYALPVAKLIFPINQKNSLLYNLLVMTGMYWGMVGFFMVVNKKKSKPK